MSEIPYLLVSTWQEARNATSDSPVILVWVLGRHNNTYMRYRGEFYDIDAGTSILNDAGVRQWSIAGVWFTYDSISWMANNSIALPFTREDLVLYYMTWGLGHE